MNKDEWKAQIESQIKVDSTYIPSFQTSIAILSEILEERDRVHEEYMNSGAHPVIEFTSDRGAKNPKQNPLLRQWNELNTTALAYMRDLGITPAGLRKLQGQLPKEKPPQIDPIERMKIAFELDDDEPEESFSPEYWKKVREEAERKSEGNHDG